jgi:radical SAM protein with 4Fe4S-binding SPASM domain
MPFDQLQIEWDGQMLPCCQIQPDAYEKDKYTLGRLTPTSDVFLEWTNANYVQWRKDLFSYEPKRAPCSTCSYGGFPADTQETRARVAVWRKMLELDAPTASPVAKIAESLFA